MQSFFDFSRSRSREHPSMGDQSEVSMKTKLLFQEKQMKTFVLVFEKDEGVKQALMEFANENRLSGAQLTAIGAFSEVTLGYFDRNSKTYRQIPINEQVEVLSFSGNIALKDGKPKLHAHVVVGKSDGTAHGGHFLEAKVWPTLEMIVSETPQHLRRVQDSETGLALIDLAA
jgi:uncharacterized protein